MKTCSTVEEMWLDYAAAVEIPPGGVQWRETRKAFYSGVAALMHNAKVRVDGQSETDVAAWLSGIERSLDKFVDEIRRQVDEAPPHLV